jgi:hypothetical protein
MKVMSGRLAGIVLSVIILRFQYNLKLSFSSTLAGVYLLYGLLSSINSAASASFWWIIFATPSCLFAYSVDASCSDAAVTCWIVSDSFPKIVIVIVIIIIIIIFVVVVVVVVVTMKIMDYILM